MKIISFNSQYVFWPLVLILSYIFNHFNVPAGWLLGALAAGIFYRLTIGPRKKNKHLFPIALGLIGLSLGNMLEIDVLWGAVHTFGFAILFGVIATLGSGLLLGYILYKRTNLDLKTAIFSFIPGGASEVLGLADTNGADIRIVAAFHSARMILLLLLFPFL
ncbi:membrane protein AbrB duplication [Lentibacillus halodurans]|uniref:Membrane protein AbrB duplication n=1 Tax=Lentibacillus halodurans TaxID=237679 RepID=A0A1I1AI46_9BACI|nr:AbrB family transcriptional regulator [Lentibacillus halodurans]SFB37701.1 membrane protein AbrB duplication [Lentibacillus halodurans]